MRIDIVVPKELLGNLKDIYKDLKEPVLVALATETQNELSNLKPPKPPRGSMKFVSEKQRRFVMASIANGSITVPYQRGIAKTSQRMNRSYRLIRAPGNVSITNSASYWEYVIGEKQAQIHKGRWKTVLLVTEKIVRSGLIEDVVKQIIQRKFGS